MESALARPATLPPLWLDVRLAEPVAASRVLGRRPTSLLSTASAASAAEGDFRSSPLSGGVLLRGVAAGVAAAAAASAARRVPRQQRCRVQRRASLRRVRPVLTAKECVPEEIKAGEYGKEAQMGFDLMKEAIHVVNLAMLCMEEKKDKTAIGLHGKDLEGEFVRTSKGGAKMSMVHTAMMAITCKCLQEEFPDDPILCEEDVGLLARDPEFAETTAAFLSDYKIIDGATKEATTGWVEHAGSYIAAARKGEGELPSRYWALTPLCTSDDFMQSKQFCMTLALVVDKQPVVSFMACPVLVFDHMSRTVPHPSGVPFFFAVKGQGAYTQLAVTEREGGVYLGKCALRGKPIPLKVGEKIKRGSDGLYDVLGTNQLRIAVGARLREDIFCDAERVGKILGSDYPKFDMSNSSIKYGWLARGEADSVWYLSTGLYDDNAVEHLAHHAAGALIAEESGAKIADLDGKDIDWCGPILENNRGLVATDPGTVPLQGLLDAIKEATSTSEELYEKRCQKRKEVSMLLKHVFSNIADYAETDEELAGAKKVQAMGMKMLKNEEEMDKVAQESIHREKPILGESTLEDDTFGRGDDGNIPLSPISMD